MSNQHLKVTAGVIIVALGLAACALPRSDPRTIVQHGDGTTHGTSGIAYAPHGAAYEQVGVASWYGKRFHGRRTASGKRFNMNALTAAHRTLPFGTRVRVTNVQNGRSVVLTINDRGPFIKGRIIDVSRHAAEHLGFKSQGTAQVRVQVIRSTRG